MKNYPSTIENKPTRNSQLLNQEAVSIRKLTMVNKVLPKRLPKQQTNNKNSIKILG